MMVYIVLYGGVIVVYKEQPNFGAVMLNQSATYW